MVCHKEGTSETRVSPEPEGGLKSKREQKRRCEECPHQGLKHKSGRAEKEEKKKRKRGRGSGSAT